MQYYALGRLRLSVCATPSGPSGVAPKVIALYNWLLIVARACVSIDCIGSVLGRVHLNRAAEIQ
jgi:hypothetical protein